MLFESGSLPEKAGDQAEGLRQLRRSDAAIATVSRVLAWPRIILISEFPGTDSGVRFAFHLACALGGLRVDGRERRSLLVDLAPAASRVPDVLRDVVPLDQYAPMWNAVAAGRTLAAADVSTHRSTSIVAEAQPTLAAVDQLPRLYEQLVRQLSRQSQWDWIVLLAVDSVVPLDRPCWYAADDIVLLSGITPSDCHRQAAAVRSRVSDGDPERRLWTVPSCSHSWRSAWRMRSNEVATTQRWQEAGIAANLLPAVCWPSANGLPKQRGAKRADVQLQRSAASVATALRQAAGCEDVSDLAKLSGCGKKIQLNAQLRPITQLSEVFRA